MQPSRALASNECPAPHAPRRRFWAALAALTLAGLALRLWNIDYGIPAIYHPDEFKKFAIIDRIVRGLPLDYSIMPLIHPGCMVNVTAGVVAVAEPLGLPHRSRQIVLCGRYVSAVFSAVTIVVTGLLGAALFSRRAGLLAAALVAASPLCTVHGRYLKEDSFQTLFTTACVLGAAWWLAGTDARRRGGLVLCAATAGFAGATKYVGLMFPILIAVFMAMGRRSRRGEIAFFILVALACFSAGSKQLVFHPREGLEQINLALSRGSQSSDGDAPLKIHQWPDLGTHFLTHGINLGLGWPLTLAALAGVGGAFRKGAAPAVRLTALAAAGWYLLTELTPLKRFPDAERYILPCVPLLAVLAAGWLGRLRRFQTASICAAWALTIALAVHSAAIARQLKPDTREQAADWLFNERMRRRPRPVAYIKSSLNYQPSRELMPGVEWIGIPIVLSQLRFDTKPAAQADILVLSHFSTDRYEDYPSLSGQTVDDLNQLRSEFPYVRIFKKPRYARAGYHNPVIEVRFRHDFGAK